MNMTPELIIGIVSAIIGVGFVKWWLYKMFKFKMDEGIVQKFLEDNIDQAPHSIETIAREAELAEPRVLSVCNRSRVFKQVENNKWVLSK